MECTICQHPQRTEISLAIQQGRHRKEVAERYGLSPSALARHIRKHAPKAPEPEPIPGLPNLASRVEWMYAQSAEAYQSAKTAADPGTQFKALQRLEKHVEMQAKLVGSIRADQATPGAASIEPQLEEILHAVNKSADQDALGLKELVEILRQITAKSRS